MNEKLRRWSATIREPIPVGWSLCPAGQLVDNGLEVVAAHLPLLAVTRNRGVVKRDSLAKRDTSSEDKSKYKRVYIGDIVYNTMRMWQGVSGMAPADGIVSPAYTVMTPRQNICTSYLSYLLKYPPLIEVFRAFSQGLVDDTLALRFEDFAAIPLLCPPLGEQRRIATI